MTIRAAILALLISFILLDFGLAFAETNNAPPPAMVPNSFADLAGNVQDAVVNVSTTQKVKSPVGQPNMQQMPQGMPQFPQGSPFNQFFEEFFNNQNALNGQNGQGPQGSSQMEMPNVQSLGSGFIIDGEKGLVVTNNHVIDQADEIQVILHDDTKLSAKVIGRDAETDLAVLKVITTKPLKSVSWGNSDAMRVGDWILAVGNPFGLGGTVTAGIVSARARNINAGRYDDFLQTDASINRGNSGGPMFNMRGEVIGINTAIYSPSGGSVGIGFAIPSNLSKPVIDQLVKFGTTKRGWIGVRIQDITPEIADSMNLPSSRGALVASTTLNGPAAKAGIHQGDVILSFNGKDLTAMRNLPKIVADSPIGKEASVKLMRMGKELTLQITPTELEKAKEGGMLDDENSEDENKTETEPLKDSKIGMLDLRAAALTPALRQRYQLDKDITGIVVTDVSRQSDAAQQGLVPGDVILEANQKSVNSPEKILDVIKQAKTQKKTSILLLVNSQNNLRFVAVKLDDEKKSDDK